MFSLFALTLFNAALAKEPCSGVKIKEDQFTHEATAEVKQAFSWGSWFVLSKVQFSGGKSTLALSIPLEGIHQVAFSAGYTVKFLLADGSVVEIATTEDTLPSPTSNSASVFTLWNVVLPITKEQATQFAAQPITSVRTELPTVTRDWSVTKKMDKSFSSTFACYATMLP